MAEPETRPPGLDKPEDKSDDTQKEELTALRESLAQRDAQVQELLVNQQALNQHILTQNEKPDEPYQVDAETLGNDPVKALDEHFDHRMAPLKNQQLETNSQVNRQIAADRLPDWKDYEEEIDTYAKRLTPEARANPDAWRQLYTHVRSEHMDEIIEKKVSTARLDWEKQRGMSVAGGLTPGASPSPPEEETVPLTPDEIAVAARMDMTPEEYQIEKTKHAQHISMVMRRRLGIGG